MKEYFGCPYSVGVDIFPLDGLSEDEAEEERRRGFIKDVQRAYTLVSSGKLGTEECRKVLSDIERQNHTTLNRKGDILRELRLLTEKLYMMYPSENAENVALMPFWVSDHNHKYSRKFFTDTVTLPILMTAGGWPWMIRYVSGYYGTAGSLAHRCRNMGKPVMLMNIL
ncbi:MAG: hypothetical protein J6O55_01190 [Lachnospiraceae bacterium]|nr:hypothetical protein [Lachnospiraceae bacterium]